MNKIDDPKNPDTTHRRATVLALHVARARVDALTALTVEFARHAGGVDANARRAVQILACFAPVLAAMESMIGDGR